MKKTLLLFLFFTQAFAVQVYDTVILGGGPGALSAAIYLARSGVSPIILEGQSPGGLIAQSHIVQNWPGEMEIGGYELAEKFRNQAIQNGCTLFQEEAIGVDFSKKPYIIFSKDFTNNQTRELRSQTVIIAMGTSPYLLGIEGEDFYWGKGISNCAVCDGPLYQNKTVAVVGGGDSALITTHFLSNICKEVHVFVRKDDFKSVEQIRKKKILNLPNVQVHFQSRLQKVIGDLQTVTHIEVERDKEIKKFSVDGVFLTIGSKPNTELFEDQIQLDKRGYIILEKGQETSKEGIYAIGDIVDPIYKQAISAAGDGAKAAIAAQQYLKDVPDDLECPKVIYIQSVEEFDILIKKNKLPIVVDFYSPSCGPCKSMAPIFEKTAENLREQYTFALVDVQKSPTLKERYKIQSMPTLLIFKDKDLIERKAGVASMRAFLEEIRSQ